LQRGPMNLFVRHWRFEVEQGLDVSTHKRYLEERSAQPTELSHEPRNHCLAGVNAVKNALRRRA
jgi:hypothetical protein